MGDIQRRDQDPFIVDQLVKQLREGEARKKSKNGLFSCRGTKFERDNIKELQSWKFQEWDYKRSGLPTYARGLFTAKNSKGHYEIVTRGYDKFFNIDEVNDTQWRNIEHKTRGPYELSNKENGCIIFMSGLEDGTLLVCSKHSTGSKPDSPGLSHAEVGERWIRKHVESVGRTTEDLAKALRKMNVTAVGELCDDSFEEHVLEYGPEDAGVYLHGINYNLPEFATLSGEKVHEFADAWGFKKAQYIIKESLSDVREFLDKCAETGSWNGQDTEGFVIRCQKRAAESVPYQDWFFKYKFEEPYLMYRQWRECTKAIIAKKEPRFSKHEAITRKYIQYARRCFAANPKLEEDYRHNHGIIALRNNFLKEIGSTGAEIIAMEEASGSKTNDKVKQDVVLVTVATLGCGKTTLANALVHLFGWGHVQNDNIQGKGRPQKFVDEVLKSMSVNPVTIADRNNHQRRERKQIIDDISQTVPQAKFIALHYVHEPKGELLPSIKEVTTARVLERGDNHQTIQASKKDEYAILGIMNGFLNRFEGVHPEREPDNAFDHIIDLDPRLSSRENLEKVVTSLHEHFPALMHEHMPSASDLDDAIDKAIKDYTVDMKHDLGSSNKTAPKKVKLTEHTTNTRPATAPPQPKQETPDQLVKRLEYFSLSVPSDAITSLLHKVFTIFTPPEQIRTYRRLQSSNRIQSTFHVTLIHRASKTEKGDIWQRYVDTYKSKLPEEIDDSNNTPVLGNGRVQLDKVIWDDRLMCLMARILPSKPENAEADESESWPCANDVPHITIGTVSPEVKPKESNDLLKKYLEVGAGKDTGIWELDVPKETILEGSVCAVLQRKKGARS
ncbi:tRNA ligase [Ascosphaera apis ARSEF 7405]|uniref:tRNA ligase n=1 Tax=Ascosphaera apis ARSEF 7405 TaxID=392613 RepID=A0A167YEU8_9EURO|nr:tRNA ligase [Ascosphaera apis ARSEF 7405]